MDLLVDTHILLWWEWRSPELTPAMRDTIDDLGNRAFVSSASIWEISIKRNSGRLDFDGDTRPESPQRQKRRPTLLAQQIGPYAIVKKILS